MCVIIITIIIIVIIIIIISCYVSIITQNKIQEKCFLHQWDSQTPAAFLHTNDENKETQATFF